LYIYSGFIRRIMPQKANTITTVKDEYHIIGISYQLRDYRLSFSINKALHFQLKKIPDFEFRKSGSDIVRNFSMYFFNDNDFLNTYCLLANHSDNIYLIPTHKQIDYFFIISGQVKPERFQMCLKSLKTIPQVLTAIVIDTDKTAQLEQLIPDIDSHITACLDQNKSGFLKLKTPNIPK